MNARSKTQLQEAERTMDTNKNFTNYRAVLKSSELPVVPFFGKQHKLLFEDTFVDLVD